MSLKLHDGQKKVLEDDSHRKLVITEVRWGKTTLAIELAIKHCKETPGHVVRLYERNYQQATIVFHQIINRLAEENLLMKTFNGMIVLTNTSRIIVDVLHVSDPEVIYDDVILPARTTVLMSPPGWKLFRGTSEENPSMTDHVAKIKPPYPPWTFGVDKL